MLVAAALLAMALQDVRLKSDTANHTLSRGVFQADTQEVLSEIRIQGNLATADEEVRRMAGVELGSPVEEGTVEAVATRLRASKRFERVEVLKRFASIADPSKIVLVIIVDEGPVRIVMTGDPDHPTKVVQSRRPRILFLPILDSSNEYGFTYGARLTLADPAGKRSRVTFPLTWGGTKSAGVEVDKTFQRGFLNRLVGGGSVSRQENPAFHENDDRWRVAIRAEHDLAPQVRIGAVGAWQYVSFPRAPNAPSTSSTFPQIGSYFVVDTRLDPFLARNAVYFRAAWDHLGLSDTPANRYSVDARGYIGLIRQPVLFLRVYRQDSDTPLPTFLKPLLGGTANLRGFPSGTMSGDTLLSGTAEVLVPVNSPLSIAKFGISVYTDVGTAYNKGERLSDQKLLQGYGSGVWFSLAFVRLSLSVAHGVGADTRVHFGGAVAF